MKDFPGGRSPNKVVNKMMVTAIMPKVKVFNDGLRKVHWALQFCDRGVKFVQCEAESAVHLKMCMLSSWGFLQHGQ